MPIVVSQQLANRYPDYIVRTIIEHTNKTETSYFITIEGTKKAAMIKASPTGELSYFKKMRKS